MTFPAVVTSAQNHTNAASTSITAVLPAGVTAGELIVAIFQTGPNSLTSATATGWTVLLDNNAASPTAAIIFAYTLAAGGETSVTVTVSASVRYCYSTYRISGWGGQNIERGTLVANAGSTTPDPPSLTPSWGAQDTLWIAAEASRSAATTAAPTSYTLTENQVTTNGTQDVGGGAAWRQLNAATENPGTFTIASNNAWIAQTYAIAPVISVTGWLGELSNLKKLAPVMIGY